MYLICIKSTVLALIMYNKKNYKVKKLLKKCKKNLKGKSIAYIRVLHLIKFIWRYKSK